LGQADSTAAQQPWYQIIGVVKELGMAHAIEAQRTAGVYLPFLPGSYADLSLIVHSRSDPLALIPRVRELAMTVDPALRIDQIMRVDQSVVPLVWFLDLWTRIIVGLTGVALLLSLSGIFAVLSYTVARRTREIGVRVALGASAHRVISSIFKRPLVQVAVGVIAGSVLIAVAAIAIQRTTQFSGTEIGGMSLREGVLLIGYAILMLGVCMLACVVPTIRALRVQPTEALRAE
jgi:ABC-type antimicrobial peptide transport system permease subunit